MDGADLSWLSCSSLQKALNSFFEADMESVFEVRNSPEGETVPNIKRQKEEEKPPDDW